MTTSADTTSKAEARYRDFPSGRQKCGLCSMFRAPDRCTYVRGDVQASGWCYHFDKAGVRAPFVKSE